MSNTGVLGGIIAGGIAAAMFNRFYNISVPEYLGFFSGKPAVPIMTGFIAIITGAILSVIWPSIAAVIASFSHWARALIAVDRCFTASSSISIRIVKIPTNNPHDDVLHVARTGHILCQCGYKLIIFKVPI